MTFYRLLLLAKLLGVMAYAGGVVAAFVASAEAERKRAAHGVASPALLVVWTTGYGMVVLSGVSLVELWILGGLVASVVSQGAVIRAVTRGDRGRGALVATILPLVIAVALMVWKPTWAGLRGGS